MACRFPSADNYDQYWNNLSNKLNSISQISSDRWASSYYSDNIQDTNKSLSKWGGLLRTIKDFDAEFFNISSREAIMMDPQQRILLEETWHCLEDARILLQNLQTAVTSVSVGAMTTDYHQLLTEKSNVNSYTCIGNYQGILANRISHLFGLTGESKTIDTACASSLVALHEAKNNLVANKCQYAFAAGVNIICHPQKYIAFSKARMLSPDGQCKTFDVTANGYVPGEGVGVLLLTTLENAINKQHHIHAVIEGSAVNHKAKHSAIHSPSVEAQSRVIEAAIKESKLSAKDITYIEAHGTGTSLGDPVEIESLTKAFSKDTSDKQYCAIGSVKTNIGHLEAAAGIAGVIKVILMMQHQKIAPTLNINTLNPLINFSQSPFYVNTEERDWKLKNVKKRYAGVSSFGFGGVNAHVILSEYRQNHLESAKNTGNDFPIVFSAKNKKALQNLINNWKDYVNTPAFEYHSLNNISYTLLHGREFFSFRASLWAKDTKELSQKIAELEIKFHNHAEKTLFYIDSINDITLEQWDTLYKNHPILKNHYDNCCRALNWRSKHFKKFCDPLFKGIILYSIGKSLFELGFKPRLLMGANEIGRIVAAGLSGYISLVDMLTLLSALNKNSLNQETTINTKLPDIPYFDASLQTIIMPFNINKETCRALRQQICIEETSFLLIKEKARLLYNFQFTFKQELTEWNKSWEPFSRHSLSSLLDEDSVELSRELELIFYIILLVCLKQLEMKWSLTSQINLKSSKTLALIELIASHYFSPHLIITWLINTTAKDCEIMAAIFNQIEIVELGHLQKLFGDNHSTTKLPLSFWMESNNNHLHFLNTVSQQYTQVTLGETGNISLQQIEKYPFFITQLWNANMINDQFRKIFNFFGHSVQLPNYPFEKEEFWLEKKEAFPNTINNEAQQKEPVIFYKECWESIAMNQKLQSEDSLTWIYFGNSEENVKNFNNAILKNNHFRTLSLYPNAIYIRRNNIIGLPINDTERLTTILSEEMSPNKKIIIIFRWASLQGNQSIEILHRLFQVLSKNQVNQIILVGKLLEDNLLSCWDESWIGLIRTLRTQFPKISLIYERESEIPVASYLSLIERFGVFLYSHNQYFQLTINKADMTLNLSPSIIKKNGCYWITGGCGQLGMAVAKYLIEKYDAHVILTGRRSYEEVKAIVDTIKEESTTSKVSYYQLNIGNATKVYEFVQALQNKENSLNGIIHAAGAMVFSKFLDKSPNQMGEVLNPKTIGTELIDELTQHIALDFICYFSSISALIGDFGLGYYAIANRYLSVYAKYRDYLCKKGLRHGKTIAIHWPLWEEGGIRINNRQEEQHYLEVSGQGLLSTNEALNLFDNMISQPVDGNTIFNGDVNKIDIFLKKIYQNNRQLNVELPEKEEDVSVDLEIETELLIQDAIRKVLKINSITRLENNTDFMSLGFDSNTLIELAVELCNFYNTNLSPSIFFSYGTINKLTKYLAANYANHLSIQKTDHNIETNKPLNIKIASKEPIAIIGMAGRFPQASNIEEFWNLLVNERSAVAEIPSNRRHDFYLNTHNITNHRGGFIEGVDEFDPLFFNLSPKEAQRMDPRQRLLLEICWHALEDAGYTAAKVDEQSYGVFIGVEEGNKKNTDNSDLLTDYHSGVLAGRISYFFNLHGPNLSLNTACSSGLMALYQAVQSIRLGECDTAIVGSANLITSPEDYENLSKLGILSSQGNCYTFDAKADGIVPGEAVVVLIIKSLSQAEGDHDRIYGTIKSISANYDGKTTSLIAPNGLAQQKLIENLYTKDDINVENIDYVLAHGTATHLGDPIEVNALIDAYKKYTNKKNYCALGSIKPNIGHTLAASGLVNVISLLLALKNEVIPKSLFCTVENPFIHFAESPFFVNKKARPWNKQHNKLRICATSAFGMSGTNVHVVIEEYPDKNSIDHRTLQVTPPFVKMKLSNNSHHDTINYVKHWKRTPLKKQENKIASEDLVLLIGNESLVSLDPLTQLFKHSIKIKLTKVTKKISNDYWQVEKSDPNAFARIIKDFPGVISRVYFLCGLSKENDDNEVILITNWFRLVKTLLSSGYEQKPLSLVTLTVNVANINKTEVLQAYASSLVGFNQSLANECPEWKIKNIDISQRQSKNIVKWLPFLENELAIEEGVTVAYRGKERYVSELIPLILPSIANKAIRHQGAYIILGGSGGLGVAFSDYLIRTFDAQIIWFGRQDYNSEIDNKIKKLSTLRRAPIYIQADASNLTSLRQALLKVKQKVSAIHGVIHSAIVLQDRTVHTMQEKDLSESIAAKINGSINLLEIFKNEDLDWMCFFSSLQSMNSRAGQSNYAAGCTFQDAYANHMRQFVSFPIHIINWGYWGEVGVVANKFYKSEMQKNGIDSISINEGIQCFEQDLSNAINTLYPFKLNESVKKEVGVTTTKVASYTPEYSDLDFSKTINKFFKKDKISVPLEQSVIQSLDEYAIYALVKIFHQLGWESTSSLMTSEELINKLSIINKYKNWFKEIINQLAKHKLITKEKNKYYWSKSLPVGQLHFDFKTIHNHHHFLNICLSHLPAILTGKVTATEILFANGSLELVESIYSDNIISKFYNETVADFIALLLQNNSAQLANGKKIKLLELGAGSGATSVCIFNKISQYSQYIEYTYTDISKHFLIDASKRYQAMAPYLKTAVIDIEKPINQQVLNEYFDIIIATNVLHATHNIVTTLNNIKLALKRNGVLLLNELSHKSLFLTLTFGLTDGWWFAEDRDMRLSGSPILNQDYWSKALTEANYDAPIFIDKKAQSLGQQIIVAGNSEWCITELQLHLIKNPHIKKNKQQNIKNYDAITINNDIANTILSVISKETNIKPDEIKLNVAFADYGIDSLVGISVIKNLNAMLNLKLNSTILFEHTSVEKLNVYIQSIKDLNIKNEKNFKSSNLIENQSNTKDIAVIGIACQFAGCDSAKTYWKILKEGHCTISEVPLERARQFPKWNTEYFYSTKPSSRQSNSQWGGFLSDITYFDPLFFNISGIEAKNMDPQQRLFLQACWSALEDSGYPFEKLSGSKTGIYVGVGDSQYHHYANDEVQPSIFWGNSSSILASRIAYILNLKGPTLAIDTACSSSLSAVYLACQSLRNHETNLAIAGGVSIQTTPFLHVAESRAQMLSPDGHCYAFDNRANGFVPGEGLGVVILKRLNEAIQDHDHIYGIIKGITVNQDGTTNGITAPSAQSQTDLELAAFHSANIDPKTINYIEAHGTGTKLGDPIEIAALTKSFHYFTHDKQFCPIGSVKTNIGHCRYASGIAGLIKVLLAMQYQQVPASLNFENANENIDFTETPFYVNKDLMPWLRKNELPLRATVSSFGFSGVNAFAIIEEYVDSIPIENNTSTGFIILPLSAKNPNQLIEYAKVLQEFIESNPISLDNLAYTYQVGRQAMNYRVAFIADTKTSLLENIKQFIRREDSGNYIQNKIDEVKVREKFHFAIDESLTRNEAIDIAKAWVDGKEITWKKLYHYLPYKIATPTYPFAKEVYHFKMIKVNSLIDNSLFYAVPLLQVNQCGHNKTRINSESVSIWLAGLDPNINETLKLHFKTISVNTLPSLHKPDDIFDSFKILLTYVKSIIYQKSTAEHYLLLVAPNHQTAFSYRYLSGFLKTLAKEYPAIRAKIIFIESNDVIKIVAQELYLETFNDLEIYYQENQRLIKTYQQVYPNYESASSFKPNGVYWITGANGGLGKILIEYLAELNSITLILSSRTLHFSMNDYIDNHHIKYIPCDVSIPAEVEATFNIIKNTYGKLNGIIHCAGVTRDSFIIHKNDDEIKEVLAPKIAGVINLDEKTKNEKLDFMVFFSSISSVLGHVGQSDYALANTFMDYYAQYRIALVNQKQRFGKTVAINWPLWKSTGMQIAEQIKDSILQSHGMDLLMPDQGVAALEAILSMDFQQVIVATGKLAQLKQVFLENSRVGPIMKDNRNSDINLARKKLLTKLIELFSDAIEMPVEKIEPDRAFEYYGVDSLIIMSLNEKLTALSTRLSKTLFYEYQTLHELNEFLLNHYYDECIKWIDLKSLITSHSVDKPIFTLKQKKSSSEPKKKNNFKIAIIGMCGRYPQAGTIETFWENLHQSRDCISEIPKNKWNWQDIYIDKQNSSYSGKSYCKYGGFIEGFASFDSLFFNISPNEAINIDPQERLSLECCWELLERSGYTRERLAKQYDKKLGVFVGVTKNSFQSNPFNSSEKFLPTSPYWSIANRISYFLDVNGPSIAIDTACSASLVSLHTASLYLKNGECKLAIVGGVNLYLHSSSYIYLCANQMLSEQNSCQSFGNHADGFIPGEGIGYLLLKPLEEAINDEDNILAVIRGSSVNHGGKTNGYTVPSPYAQSELVLQALKEADIHPRTISYIEAHGTGTTLGDPIEINGLTKAFKQYTDDNQYCSIGSVKSNIGHCEAAAGIAGITKVILQMQNKKLVPSLHAEKLNTNIDFTTSPFKLQQTLEDWIRPCVNITGENMEYPRIAGISAFGAGGANAHVIIEEYSETSKSYVSDLVYPLVFPLSARTEERLNVYAEKLIQFIESNHPALENLTSTFQMGREGMEYRVAFLVNSITELVEKLKGFTQKKAKIDNCFYGKLNIDKSTVNFLTDDEDSLEMITQWVKKNKVKKIAELWVKGLTIDWNLLYLNQPPKKIVAPTYPFEHQEFWIPESSVKLPDLQLSAQCHPLVHTNVSDFTGQHYISHFTGDEFFLTNHILNQQKTLPGTAYIEMARTVGELSTKKSVIEIRDMVWIAPLIVTKNCEIQINLWTESDDIYYEVSSHQSENIVVHNRGKIIVGEKMQSPKKWDIASIQNRCHQTITPEILYENFAAIGLNYGKYFRAITSLYYHDTEAVCTIELPIKAEGFVLHPSLLDAAFQSTVVFAKHKDKKCEVPFALASIKLFSNLPEKIIAYSQLISVHSRSQINVYLINPQGEVCALLTGLESRAFKQIAALPTESIPTIYYATPIWKEKQPQLYSSKINNVTLFVAAMDKNNVEQLAANYPALSIHILPESNDKANMAIESFYIIFNAIQAILLKKPTEVHYIVVLINQGHNDYCYLHLTGLLKTAMKEHPKIKAKSLLVSTRNFDELSAILTTELTAANFDETEIYYPTTHLRQIRILKETIPKSTSNSVIKNNGVYWITGGLGGLGSIVARDLSKLSEVKIILTGRSMLDDEKRVMLNALKKNNNNVDYLPCDVSNMNEVAATFNLIKSRYGKLNGIIHSAGVIKDKFIIQKSLPEMALVLNPKISGILYLDQITQKEPLDFMVLFSSLAGFTGNVGQSDYAAANAFLDNYAHHRQSLVQLNQRFGKTIAIDWSLWEEGGMQVNEQTKVVLSKTYGIDPIKTPDGLLAFYDALSCQGNQMIVIAGNKSILKETLFEETIHDKSFDDSKIDLQNESLLLQDLVKQYLKELLHHVLKIKISDCDYKANFSEYGVDSLRVIELTRELEKDFGLLSKTLFFEYHTIEELSHYLMNEHAVTLTQLFGTEKPKEVEVRIPVIEKKIKPLLTKPKVENIATNIAIIGVTGQYPQANDLTVFWENLASGKDCITEIPAERWSDNLTYREKAKAYGLWGGFIQDMDKFDPLFFNISPREAEHMDPQERLFLQCAWNALEDAGYTRTNIGPSVGVFVGVMYEEYQLYGVSNTLNGNAMALGSGTSSIANRVSYYCNFTGPSIAINTMCSSSLTAVHLACQSIRQGECAVALAGGVNLSVHPNKYILLGQHNFMSSKGRCESFGKGGDGYVPSEGVGCLVLKPLAKAVADKDYIYGVIKATAINHGGKTNGYTVPNPNAQFEVVANALREANIPVQAISYIEAHGTGTALGDPIEINGLATAFKQHTNEIQYCRIGSVKSNIGHCESAAGVAAITKVLLQMQKKKLVPSLHALEQNANIDFTTSPFKLQQTLEDWNCPRIDIAGESVEYPLIAGISAFGAGGSNAHVIIEEYLNDEIAETPFDSKESSFVLPLSARTEVQLKVYAKNIANFLKENKINLASFAYTYQVGREAMSFRVAFIVKTSDELREVLQQFIDGNFSTKYCYQEIPDENTIRDLLNDLGIHQVVNQWFATNQLQKLAKLWISGADIKWQNLYNNDKPKRLPAPYYPFTKKLCWVNSMPNDSSHYRLGSLLQTLALDHSLHEPNTICFKTTLSTHQLCIDQHRVNNEIVVPGAVSIELIAQAIKHIYPQKKFSFNNIVWLTPIKITGKQKEIIIKIIYKDEILQAQILTENKKMQCHAKSTIALEQFIASESYDVNDYLQRFTLDWEGDAEKNLFYQKFADKGLNYGNYYRMIDAVWHLGNEVLVKIILPKNVIDELMLYQIHPAVMDALLQSSAAVMKKHGTMLPFSIQYLACHAPMLSTLFVYIKKSDSGYYDITLLNENSHIIIECKNCVFRPIKREDASVSVANVVTAEDFAPEIVTHFTPSDQNQEKTIEKLIYHEVSDLLKITISEIKVNKPLSDYGVDSIVGTELIQRLNDKLKLDLYTTVIFDYPTISQMAQFIAKENPIKILNSTPTESPLTIDQIANAISEGNLSFKDALQSIEVRNEKSN